MKILIDIGHPAHVHLFKNLAAKLLRSGSEVLFTYRENEFESYLLNHYGFNSISFGKKFSTPLGKIWGLLKFNVLELSTILKFKPDIILSHGSPYAAQASKLSGKIHISLEDTGNMEQVKLYQPFTDCILTPDVLTKQFGKNNIKYAGYHELAFLHPNNFQPDKSIFKYMRIPEGTPYAILRFSSMKATHDIGYSGLSIEFKKKLIEVLQKKMAVFISSEDKSSSLFNELIIRFPPEKIHDALSFASIYVGEGASMASEAAVLGTPSIYINPRRTSYCDDLEKYGLLNYFPDQEGVLEKIEEILSMSSVRAIYLERRNKMLLNKIDVTSFLFWFVTNYPDSLSVSRDTDYQHQFN